MKRAITLLLAALVLAGCTGTGTGTVKLTAADNGKTIDLKTGQTVVLTLDSNATTGYRWNLESEPAPKVLKWVSSEYKSPNSQLVGAGGQEVWTWQAAGPGTATVKLLYYRPPSKQQSAGEFTFAVNVK